MFTVWCDLVALNFKKARLCQGRHIRLRLVRVKVFSERKMFSCVWLHFKKCFGKYFLMFGCVLENTIETHFLLVYSYFLTFSRLPNEYIISFISQNTNKNPEKNHQIRTNIARSRSAHCGDAFAVPVMSSFAFMISSFFLPLSFSLSLLFSKAGSHLKWKWKYKWFSVVLALKFGQLEMLFSLTEFEVTTKHPIFRKIISGISLKSIQTQPKSQFYH